MATALAVGRARSDIDVLARAVFSDRSGAAERAGDVVVTIEEARPHPAGSARRSDPSPSRPAG